MLHSKTKRVDLDYHFIREKFLANEIAIQYVSSTEQKVDIFTKVLLTPQFLYLRPKLNVTYAPLSLWRGMLTYLKLKCNIVQLHGKTR